MRDATSAAADALAAVRATVEKLAGRADVVFLHRRFGEPAAAGLLRQHRERPDPLPEALLALYALANGLRIQWQWLGGEAGGYLHLPPLRPDSFTTSADTHLDAVHGRLLRVMPDSALPNYGLYLPANPADPTLYECDLRPGADWAAHSLTEGLHRLAATCFAENWHYHVQQEYVPQLQHVAPLLARLAEPAEAARPIGAGARVVAYIGSSRFDKRYCRGEVLGFHDLPPGSELTHDLKRRDVPPTFALLRHDVTGQPCWLPLERLRPAPDDAYEYFWVDPARLLTLGRTASWEVALRRMALAWGPMSGASSFYTHHWEVPAALLRRFPLTEAFELVRRVVEEAEAAIVALPAGGLVLTEAERAQVLFPAAWAEHYLPWQSSWDGPLEVLMAGLICRVYFAEPAERKTIRLASIKGLQAARKPSNPYWPSGRDFYRYLKTIIGNKDLGIGTPFVRGFYGAHPDLPGEYDRFDSLASATIHLNDELWVDA